MKKIVVFALLLASCKNKKAELVDLERKYSDSVDYYKRMLDKSATDYASGTGSAKDEIRQVAPIAKKEFEFKKLVDSIEWDLKKY